MGPDKAWGANKIWGPGIDHRTPWKSFSLRPWLPTTGLKNLLNVCSHYAVKHDMVLNNENSVDIFFRSKRFTLSCMPNSRIGDKVIKFSSSVKYHGVCSHDTITDNEDIKRQMKYLYGTAN